MTGITGFVGSHLADYILEEFPDIEVIGLARWRSPRHNIHHILNKINLCYGDLTDLPSLNKIISEHQLHEKDTGSADVQVALITKEIEQLAKHLKKHSKDNHSRRGLLKMVSRRKKLLEFLKKGDEDRYSKTIKKLGLKK